MKNAVELKNVTKSFGEVEVLKSINLEVRQGEFLVFVGPSGCGKSTLLRLIAGLETLTSGEIYIGGELVNNVDPRDRDIAMVFQNYALYPHMTVFNNMAFGLKVRKMPEAEIKKRVEEAAELLQLQDYLSRKPKQLSGGQRQRVALGRAIVRRSKVFLFDEPLSNLDAKLRNEMRVEIKKLHHLLGNTMIYVTHDQTEATTMGDRIAIFNQGIIQQIASPVELYRQPANRFVGGFIGMPEMNFVDGKVEQSDNNIDFHYNGTSLRVPQVSKSLNGYNGRSTTLGVRPDYVRIDSKKDQNDVGAIGKVDLVENLGSQSLVHVKTGDVILRSLTSHDETLKPGSEVLVHIDPEGLHFFDQDSGKCIY